MAFNIPIKGDSSQAVAALKRLARSIRSEMSGASRQASEDLRANIVGARLEQDARSRLRSIGKEMVAVQRQIGREMSRGNVTSAARKEREAELASAKRLLDANKAATEEVLRQQVSRKAGLELLRRHGEMTVKMLRDEERAALKQNEETFAKKRGAAEAKGQSTSGLAAQGDAEAARISRSFEGVMRKMLGPNASKVKQLQGDKEDWAASISSRFDAKIKAAGSDSERSLLSSDRDRALEESNRHYEKLIAAIVANTAGYEAARTKLDRENKVNSRSRLTGRLGELGGSVGNGLSRAGGGAVRGLRNASGGILGAVGLGAVGSILGILGGLVSEGMKLDQASSSVSGLGANVRGGGRRFGMTQADYISKARSGMIAGGSADYDYAGQLRIEKGFSMNDDALAGLASTSRLLGEGRKEGAAGIARDIIATMRANELGGMRKRDGASTYVNLGEKVEQTNAILTMMADQQKEADVRQATALLAFVNKAGYDDQRAGRIVQSINESIKNPGDEFRQAFVLRALKEVNPDMGYYQLTERQEAGATDVTNVEAVLDAVVRRYGTGEEGAFNLQRVFGLANRAEARGVMQAYTTGDEDGARQRIIDLAVDGDSQMEKDARGAAGVIQQAVVGFRDELAKGGIWGIQKAQEAYGYLSDKMKDGLIPGLQAMAKEAWSALVDFWDSGEALRVGAEIAKGFSGFLLGSDPMGAAADAAKSALKTLSPGGYGLLEGSLGKLDEAREFFREKPEDDALGNLKGGIYADLDNSVPNGNSQLGKVVRQFLAGVDGDHEYEASDATSFRRQIASAGSMEDVVKLLTRLVEFAESRTGPQDVKLQVAAAAYGRRLISDSRR